MRNLRWATEDYMQAPDAKSARLSSFGILKIVEPYDADRYPTQRECRKTCAGEAEYMRYRWGGYE